MFNAKILADSKSPNRVRLTTMEWTFPRSLLAETRTHRAAPQYSGMEHSMNAASSRAIPHSKMRKRILENPYIPPFQKNQSGMQSSTELSDDEYLAARCQWLFAMGQAVAITDDLTGTEKRTFVTPLIDSVDRAKLYLGKLFNGQRHVKFSNGAGNCELSLDIHKQFTNRLLEPFMWCTIIISATDWDNLFALRYHPAAEPSFQRIAQLAYEALEASEPKDLPENGWHLPLMDKDTVKEVQELCWDKYGINSWEKSFEMLRKISVGRCARVSYLTHEGKRSIEDDIALHDRLSSSRPGHWSPFEHVATPAKPEDMVYRIDQLEVGDFDTVKQAEQGNYFDYPIQPKSGEIGYCGNFKGWKQYRKFFEAENITEFKPA